MGRSAITGIAGLILFCMMSLHLLHAAGTGVEKGKRLYEEKRCGLCHAIGGKGGKSGPDLSDVGNKRDAQWLMKFFTDPKGTMSGSKMLPVKATDEDLQALSDYMLSLKK